MTTNCVAVARPLVYGKGSAMSLTTLYGEMQDTYLALIRTFPLRPIRSEGELDEAMEVLNALCRQGDAHGR